MLGSQTQVVNGQRFSVPSHFQYAPSIMGVQTTSVPLVSPTMPPFIGGAVSGAQQGGSQVGGYGTADNNTLVTQIASEHPHSLKVSPTWWAVGCLGLGLVLLNAVHWRKTTLESIDVHGNAGPASADAGEKVD